MLPDAILVPDAILPNARELKALKCFKSTDTTRMHLAVIWQYISDGGCTHSATDGHTIALRRAGTHTLLALPDIAKLPCTSVEPIEGVSSVSPPAWWSVIKAPRAQGKNVERRGINPAYFARVAEIERTAGQRAADDYVPPAGLSKKDAATERAALKTGAWAEWVIGCDPLDGWYWEIRGDKVRWEGIIMPRRV